MSKLFQYSTVSKAADTKVVGMCGAALRDMMQDNTALDYNIQAIRAGKTEYKRVLPGACWAAVFTDGTRHAISASHNGLCYIDIDHVGQNPHEVREYYAQHVLGREEELEVLFAQVSPSGTGLHIVWLFDGESHSIEEAQLRFARLTGITYDEKCKDMSRMLFFSIYRDVIYDNLDALDSGCYTPPAYMGMEEWLDRLEGDGKESTDEKEGSVCR